MIYRYWSNSLVVDKLVITPDLYHGWIGEWIDGHVKLYGDRLQTSTISYIYVKSISQKKCWFYGDKLVDYL